MAVKYWYKAANGSDNWSTAGNWYFGSGGTGGAAGLPTASDDVIFDGNSGTGTITIAAAATCRSLYAQSGFSGTIAGTSTLAVSGSNTGTSAGLAFEVDLGVNYTYSGTITFSGTGGYVTIFPTASSPMVFNSATGTWDMFVYSSINTVTLTTGTLLSSGGFTISGLLTHTAGTINFGTVTHFIGRFNSNNSNTRTIDFGTSTINITGNNNTVWTTSTSTGLTTSGTATLNFTYSGATGTRSILTGGIAANVSITAGTDTINDSTGTQNYNNLDFTGFSGTFNSTANKNIRGNIIFSTTQALTGTTSIIFLGASVTQTITSNGLTIPYPITINSATTTVQYIGTLTTSNAITVTTGTFNINGNLTIPSGSTFTLTAGTINVNNGANISCGLFNSNNSNVRTLNMGWGTWTITGAGSPWTIASTGLTFNAQQSRILFNNTGGLNITFAAGGLTYYTVEFSRTGGCTITGSNTFANFIDNSALAAHGFTFQSGATQTFYKFNVRGAAGTLVTIGSGGTPAFLVKAGQGIVCYSDYLSLATGNTSASPANTWYRGANSTGTSTGWIATGALSSQSLGGIGGVG